MAARPETPDRDRARRAGRGLVAIVLAKAHHIVTGYAVAVILPRLLGSPEVFGRYSKVMAALAILDNVLAVATVQSVSKLVSEDDGRARQVLRPLIGVHAAVGALAAGAVFLAAPAIASFHREPALAPLLRVAALIPLGYTLYAVAAGFLNGRQRFGAQAGLDVAFYTLRFAGILGAAALVGGALAPIAGVAVAVLLAAAIGLAVVGPGQPGAPPLLRRWIAFTAPLWLYHALLNGMLELDVQVLAKTVAELAVAGGRSAARASEIANTHVGFYHAAQTFAFVPFQLMMALTFVVFPMVARATASGDDAEARTTIRAATRVALLGLLAAAAPIAGAADGVMRLAYPDAYLAGAPALAVLAVGIVFASLFAVAAAILTGAGQPGRVAAVALAGLAVSVVGNALLVTHVGIGERTLAAAALGSSAGMAVAALAAGALVLRRFGPPLSPRTALRSGLAAAAGFAAAHLVPHATRIGAALALAAGVAAYLLALVALRELGAADLRAAREALRRRA